jgi:hypothetical protein
MKACATRRAAQPKLVGVLRAIMPVAAVLVFEATGAVAAGEQAVCIAMLARDVRSKLPGVLNC